MRPFLFFSLKLVHFSNLFQSGGGWDVFGLSANSWVPLGELHSNNSFKSSWSRFDLCPGPGSFLKNVSPERNFENQFRTWRSVKTPWPWTLEMFFAVPVTFLLFLNITYWICTLNSSILEAWNCRLNFNAHTFIIEIRMTDKGNLQSRNFWLRLKHWKFEMPSYNLLLKNANYLWRRPIYTKLFTNTGLILAQDQK